MKAPFPTPVEIAADDLDDIFSGETYIGTFASHDYATFAATAINAHEALVEALEALIAEVGNRQRPHQCPGFDCATCTPIEALSNASRVLTLTKEGDKKS
jgi:hypothetical protein